VRCLVSRDLCGGDAPSRTKLGSSRAAHQLRGGSVGSQMTWASDRDGMPVGAKVLFDTSFNPCSPHRQCRTGYTTG
jgi:hypothetical protein